MSINIKKAGFLTTVQDLGRNGFRRFGINPNGAMDKTAVRLINILLGNAESEAVLEMHFPAPEILFEAIRSSRSAARISVRDLNNDALENWRVYFAAKDRVLKFTGKNFGNRAYLAIRGGLQIEKWLNSASTNLIANIGGFHGRVLKMGDVIDFKSEIQTANLKNKNTKSPIL